MTKRKVMISIESERQELMRSIFEEAMGEESPEEDGEFEDGDPIQVLVEGRLVTGRDRVELLYDEQDASGMGGSTTAIGFDRTAPELISMMRTGPVNTTMVFEERRRHICVYNTPFSQFEICTHAIRVDNRILTEGRLLLDYLIEVRGARAERCKMVITLRSMNETETLISALN